MKRIAAALLVLGASFAAAQSPSTPDPRTGTLKGRVMSDTSGTPVVDALLNINGLTVYAHTDNDGQYVLRDLPAGTRVIRIRQIGFRTAEATVTIVADSTTTADFRISRLVTKLDTQTIKAANPMHKPARLMDTDKYDDFYQRKLIGAGGYQFTHEELEKKVNARLEEVFSSMPGVKLSRQGSRYGINLGTCPQQRIMVFVDGHKEYPMVEPTGPLMTMPGSRPPIMQDGPMDVLSQFDLSTVEAMEVYKDLGGLPAEARGNACAAIYIWTR